MEEILKSLQGKSMTKKSLFDFLSEINLEEFSKPKNTVIYEDIVIHPIKEEIQKKKRRGRKPKEKPKEKPNEKSKEILPTLSCNACNKVFSTQTYLDNHYKNTIVCKKWIELAEKPPIVNTKGIHLIIDELLEKSINDNNKLECKYCKYVFSIKGNLHKHYNTSILCNSLAIDEFKKLMNNFNSINT
jgi:hypothetical protein